MVITRSTQLRQRRVLLTREPLAAGQARSHVRAAIRAWSVPVDPDIAVLLTSDLVTDAITYWAGQSVTLAIRCSRDALRVDVTGASRPRPGGGDEPVATGCGLVLVAALSTQWGAFRAPAGHGHVLHPRVRAPARSRAVIARPSGSHKRGDGEP